MDKAIKSEEIMSDDFWKENGEKLLNPGVGMSPQSDKVYHGTVEDLYQAIFERMHKQASINAEALRDEFLSLEKGFEKLPGVNNAGN